MKDRQNRETGEPRERSPRADPSMREKDTSEERQYDEKAGKNTPRKRTGDTDSD